MALPKFKLKDLYNPFGYLRKAATSFVNDITGASAVQANNANVDKQIAAQKQENQSTREYNLELAKLQNEWNIEQWERENEYNSPKNQMDRLVAAGLNRNLAYQNLNTSSASIAGSLTSGSPAESVDYSAMSRRGHAGTALAQGILKLAVGAISAGQNINMKQVDILAKKISNRKAINDADFQEWLLMGNPSATDSETLKFVNSPAGKKALEELNGIITNNKLRGLQLSYQEFENQYKKAITPTAIEKFKNDADITANQKKFSDEEVKYVTAKVLAQLGILRSEAIIKAKMANKISNDFDTLLAENGFGYLPGAINMASDVISNFIPVGRAIKGLKGAANKWFGPSASPSLSGSVQSPFASSTISW